MRFLSPKNKLKAVKEVLQDKKSLAHVASKYSICRQTLALWIKKYQKDPKSGSRILINGYKRGKNHHRRLAYKLEKLILDLVIKNPDLGVHIIWKQLSDRGFKVSPKGVYSVLLRYELQTKELRHRFSLEHPVKTIMAQALSPAYRAKIVEQYLKESAKISRVCKLWKVSRPTFYSWLAQYRQGLPAGRQVEALVRRYKKGYEHHRSISQEAREAILDLVRRRPDYSCHRLYANLSQVEGKPIVGHHAVQNLLSRENLNTQEKRKIYAQGYLVRPEVAVAPEYEAAAMPAPSRWRFLFAPFATIPKFVIKTPFTWPLALPLFLLILYIFEADKLLRPAMFFPTVALTFGLLFFLYSLKYYYSLIIVLAYPGQSQKDNRQRGQEGGKLAKFLERINVSKLLAPVGGQHLAMQPNLDEVNLARYPFVSIHLPLYNEKRVAERILRACREIDYPRSTGSGQANFEVIIVDDSTDETTQIIKEFLADRNGKLRETKGRDGEEVTEFIANHSKSPAMTLIHRASRAGFKGAALAKALEYSDPKTEYVCVFDADFVPYPDTVEQFVKTFQVLGQSPSSQLTVNSSQTKQDSGASVNSEQRTENQLSVNRELITDNRIAAVQGYQWHVLNKSENWVTRGVRTEYAGSYVVERAGIELYGGLKMIAGSVFCIRADVLRKFGWGTSITEDLELTLKLYEAGYKVAFTPYIQAPAEAVSTVRRLIRQRMRWAEGHTFNVRKMWRRLWQTPNMTSREKFEFLYLAPYYLQAAFFIIGTFSWFVAEAVVHAQLPFWTAAWGWSLVFVNLLSLPLMNLVGLFLEESDERDYLGVASFVLLSYLLVPFQGYAAVKALFEKEEGPWFRTPKTGKITDIFGRARFYRWIERFRIIPRPAALPIPADIGANPRRADLRGFGFNQRELALVSSFNPLSGYKISPRRLPYAARGAIVFLLIISLLLNYLAFFPIQNEVQADGSTPALEQQINIIDQEATTTNATFSPTDNSLGVVKYDSTVFDGTVSVNFEALMKVSGTDGNVGSGIDMDCSLAATDCRIVYYDVGYSALRYVDCGDATCSTANATFTLLDGASGCAVGGCSETLDMGQYPSIGCPAANNCQIFYYDATNGNLMHIDCANAACSTRNFYETLDQNGDVGQYTSTVCPDAFDCLVAYYDVTNTALKKVYCYPYAGCSAMETLDGASGCVLTGCSTASVGKFTSVQWLQYFDGFISYYDSGNGDLKFAYCDFNSGGSFLCTGSGNGVTTVDSSGDVGQYTSISCLVNNDCKVSYYDVSNQDLRFVDCGNITCSSGNTQNLLDGNATCSFNNAGGDGCSTNNVGQYSSIKCPAATDCKVSYYDVTSGNLKFGDCADANCGTNGYDKTVESTNDVGSYSSIDCVGGAADCKIAHYDATAGDLRFYDCANANVCVTGTATLVNAGTATATADLYTSSGTKQNAEVLTTNTSYTSSSLVRTSSAISLSTDDYTVRLKSSGAGITASMKAARIIIKQTASVMLTKTETQVELGYNSTTTSTSYTAPSLSKFYCYDSTATGINCSASSPSRFSPSPTAYFEATLANSTAGGTAYALLSLGASVSPCISQLSSSEVAVSGTSYTRQRTASSISLTAGTYYAVCFKSSSSNTAKIASAKIILQQSDATNGITAVETLQMYINNTTTTTQTAYTSTNFFNTYSSSSFTGTKTFYFGSSLQASNKDISAKARLWDGSTGSGEVLGSNIYVIGRSSLTEPTNNALDTQISVTGAGTGTYAVSSLIIQIQSLPVPEIAIFALPGMVFLPRIVRWIKERRLRRKKQRGVGNDPPPTRMIANVKRMITNERIEPLIKRLPYG